MADPTPALYLAYNKSTQLAAQAHFPAHVACRTMHSLAYRAMRMFEQQHRLERKLTGGEVAELLAIPALDGLRPSFWGHCVVVTVRSFTHDTAREIGAQHLPPLPQGPDRAELVVTFARRLWARMRDPADEVPLEHDAYLKMWHLEGARLPGGAGVLYVDEAQDANPVTLAILQAQRRPTVWVGDPWQSIYRFRGSVNAMRAIAAPQRHLSRSWRFGEDLACLARAILAHTSEPPPWPSVAIPGSPPCSGPCARPARSCAGPMPACSRRRSAAATGSTSWAGSSPWPGSSWAAGSSTRGSRCRTCRAWPASAAGTSSWRRRTRRATRSCASWSRSSSTMAARCRAWWRTCAGGRCRIRRRRSGCWRRRTRPRAWSGRGCGWPTTSRAWRSWMPLDQDGLPYLTPEERDQELHLLYVAATRALGNAAAGVLGPESVALEPLDRRGGRLVPPAAAS